MERRNTPGTPQVRGPQDVRTVTTFHQQIRTGPLPDPETLIRYGQALPDAPERILKMAEEQAHHRQGLERKSLDANIAVQARGQYIGAVIATLALSYGSALLYLGKSVEGFSVVGSVAVSLAAVWVLGKIEQHKNLKQKSKAPSDEAPPEAPK